MYTYCVTHTHRPPLSRKEWLNFFLVRLPILEWVWSYRPSYFVGDIISGITVAIMHIPQGVYDLAQDFYSFQ